jgi:lysozyme family protein
MSDSTTAIKLTLVHEGGYVNAPNDAGGETNFGISKREYPGEDIKNMTVDRATEIYKEGYWKNLYSQISSQLIANKLFDMGVLFGVGTAVGILQLSAGTTVDHIFGVNTLAAVNQANEDSLLATYKTNMVTHAFNIATQNPNDRAFLKGWTTRINS